MYAPASIAASRGKSFAAEALCTDEPDEWHMIASKSCALPKGATITAAELQGAPDLINFLCSYYQSYDEAVATIPGCNLISFEAVRILILAQLV